MLNKLMIMVQGISLGLAAGVGFTHEIKFPIHLNNQANVQRGVALFMNYCSGCHSLRSMRYSDISDDLGITPELLKSNLIFTQVNLSSPIEPALSSQDAKQWFGLVAPDLSLSARQRGAYWLYRYLTGFYPDKSRPFGVNNRLLPNSAMPDVVEPLKRHAHGEQEMEDLIDFLVYVSDPSQLVRTQLGPFVILFLILLLFPIYYLKKLYWKNRQDI